MIPRARCRDRSPCRPTWTRSPAGFGLVIDPELGVNIVDLGLVYRAEVVDGVAHVLMTTTTPACPIGSFLSDQVRWALLGVDGIHEVEIELTHEPPWSPNRMSDEAKVQMGWA